VTSTSPVGIIAVVQDETIRRVLDEASD
jgi:hypothetical protein